MQRVNLFQLRQTADDSLFQLTHLPKEILFHILNSVDLIDYLSIIYISKLFMSMGLASLFTRNIATFSKTEQLVYLLRLCLKAEEEYTKQKNFPLEEINNHCNQLTDYLQTNDNISPIEAAAATTALYAFSLKNTDYSPKKKYEIEKQLRFHLNLAYRYDPRLIIALIAQVKFIRGNFTFFFDMKGNRSNSYHFDTLVILNKISELLVSEAEELHLDPSQFIQYFLKNHCYFDTLGVVGRSHDEADRHLIRLWCYLRKNKQDDFYFKKIMDFISSYGKFTYSNDYTRLSFKLQVIVHLFTQKQIAAIFDCTKNFLQVRLFNGYDEYNKSTAMHLFLCIYDYLSPNQLIEINNIFINQIESMVYLVANRSDSAMEEEKLALLVNRLCLTWNSLSVENKKIFLYVIGLRFNSGYCYNKLWSFDPIQENERHGIDILMTLCHFDKDKIFKTLFYIYNPYEPSQKNKRIPHDLQLCLHRYQREYIKQIEFNLECDIHLNTPSFKEQLNQIALFIENYSQSPLPFNSGIEPLNQALTRIKNKNHAINLTKELIKFFCYRASSIEEIRELITSFESARFNLSYLIERDNVYHIHNNFLFIPTFGISARRHQWQSFDNTSLQWYRYTCSKNWIDCMTIFKTHLLRFEKQWNDKDKIFMKQTGSGWVDETIKNTLNL